jgi:DNA-binding LacI/PurR family transcriptional regulator
MIANDAPVFNALPDFSFTYIDQFEYKMGYEAADIMINLLQNNLPENEYIKKILRPKIIIGKTTGEMRTGK